MLPRSRSVRSVVQPVMADGRAATTAKAVRSSLRALATAILAMAVSVSCALADAPTSASYAIPASVLNAGLGLMTSPSYELRSSLGDNIFGAASTSPSYRVTTGLWSQIYGSGPVCVLDLDGNGRVDALTDGLLLVRAMLGLTGSAVTSGAIGSGAVRQTWAQIQPAVRLAAFDVDGNQATTAATDGVLLVRAMFGMTGTGVTTGAVGAGASRNTWNAIRTFVNTTCGTAFEP